MLAVDLKEFQIFEPMNQHRMWAIPMAKGEPKVWETQAEAEALLLSAQK